MGFAEVGHSWLILGLGSTRARISFTQVEPGQAFNPTQLARVAFLMIPLDILFLIFGYRKQFHTLTMSH